MVLTTLTVEAEKPSKKTRSKRPPNSSRQIDNVKTPQTTIKKLIYPMGLSKSDQSILIKSKAVQRMKIFGAERNIIKVKEAGYYVLDELDDFESHSDKKEPAKKKPDDNRPPKKTGSQTDSTQNYLGLNPSSHPECAISSLPQQISLNSEYFGAIRDQNGRGTCTAQAMSTVATYVWNRNHNLAKYFSANWVYAREKDYRIRSGLNTLENIGPGGFGTYYKNMINAGMGGFIEEDYFPYQNPLASLQDTDPYVQAILQPYTDRYNGVTQFPPACSHVDTSEYKGEVEELTTIAHAYAALFIKTKLCQDLPVYFKIAIPLDAETGDSKMYNSYLTANDYTLDLEDGLPTSGGHAMVIVGYDDATQKFRVRNSWGDDWADQGEFWMTYQTFNSYRRNGILTIHKMDSYTEQPPLLYEDLTGLEAVPQCNGDLP